MKCENVPHYVLWLDEFLGRTPPVLSIFRKDKWFKPINKFHEKIENREVA